ncbi:MAG: hypothetical protein KatS3mg060_1820 [Dehalococcoidia bacterium]|nr:MAG: hypothetical protein KatS3mg060_1820 [Dehalococcoidia bacterium]
MPLHDSAYRSLFAANPLATWVVAGDTLQIVEANPAAAGLAGLPLEDLIGRSALDFLVPADDVAFLAPPGSAETLSASMRRFRSPSGEDRIVAVHAQPFDDAGTKRFIIVLHDITAQVTRAVDRSRAIERHRLIAQVVGDASWDWDIQHGTVWWDDTVDRVFGYQRTEIEESITWWTERIHPDDRERILSSLDDAFAGDAEVWEGVYRFRRGDGQYADVRDRGAIVRDAAGRAIRMVGAMVDISEFRQIARALEQSEARFRALFDQAPIGVAELAFDGTILRSNAAFTQLIGASLMEGETINVLSVIAPEDQHRLLRSVKRLYETGKGVVREEVRCQRRNGSPFWAEATVSLFLGEDADTHVGILLLQDITSRKAAEQRAQDMAQAEKLRALGQMASGVAHNLNQSLGLISGHSQLALAELDRLTPNLELLRESVQLIRQAVDDGAATVKRLQTFARPGSEGSPQIVDLATLLEDVARLTAPQWRDIPQQEGRPIRLTVGAEPGLVVQGWPEALHEALFNLVFNAVDALPAGGEIVLSAHREGDDAIIEVIDTGVGMPEEMVSMIFEPFFTTKGERGTGIGLPTVFRIVDRHRGTIAVRSKPGAGTTFTIRLPAPPIGTPARTGPRTATRGPIRRVLVVDDDLRIAEMARRMLELDQHQVEVAGSAEEALTRLAAAPFDVIISDLGLGTGMNGWDLAETVRQRWPQTHFVLATGWGAELDAAEARARGVNAIIAKPYTVADLRRQLAD